MTQASYVPVYEFALANDTPYFAQTGQLRVFIVRIFEKIDHTIMASAALYIDGFVQDWSISSALAMEILQSCTKPSIYTYTMALPGCTYCWVLYHGRWGWLACSCPPSPPLAPSHSLSPRHPPDAQSRELTVVIKNKWIESAIMIK